MPYGAGNSRKNARKFYFFISSLQVAVIAEAVRWHYAIVVAYAEKDRKTLDMAPPPAPPRRERGERFASRAPPVATRLRQAKISRARGP